MADGRRAVVERGLVAPAIAALTRRALGSLPFEALGPTKALLKRYFSTADWGPADDDELARAVGPGEGWWSEPLDGGLTLVFGWEHGRFRLAVAADGAAPAAGHPVAPEATPNPRTMTFRTGHLHDGESVSYRSAAEAAADGRVAALFEAFPEVDNVLVARDFVSVTLRRPGAWEGLLAPVLAAVEDGFAGGGDPAVAGAGGVPGAAAPASRDASLERAWRRLGALRADDPADLAMLLAAADGDDAAERRVAAGLLDGAPPEAAHPAWEALAADPRRSVRRAAVDAMAGAGRPALRRALERALGDNDAWVRWKAVRGLSVLGAGASREAVEALAGDPDLRVRMEVQAALRDAG
ncbi:MAG TPA: NifU N-terminal domain-containing protein [Acidimicrobiales bacterium]|nr:NifU N-terminal domain-containing protein [Acidimicrobiales bacterium]